MRAAIDVNLLGPLEVRVAGAPVQFDGAKQRMVFTALALRAPEPVSVDALLEVLWGEEQPGGAVQALQKQVSRLRQRLGESPPLHHRPAGYALEIERDAIDRTGSRICCAAPASPSRSMRPTPPVRTSRRRSS